MTPQDMARQLTDAVTPMWRHVSEALVERHEAAIVAAIAAYGEAVREACARIADRAAAASDFLGTVGGAEIAEAIRRLDLNALPPRE